MKAIAELQLLGVFLTKEKIDREKVVIKVYQEWQSAKNPKRKKKREQKRMQKDIPVFHED